MSVYCKFCGMCCKLIPVKGEERILVRDGFQMPDDEFINSLKPLSDEEALNINENYVKTVQNMFEDVKFYSCKYLTADNKCFIENNKPSFCKSFPSSPLALVPDECGYLGDIFIKNEELKRKIRMIKQDILDYKTLIEMGDKDSKSYTKIIDNLSRFVKKYEDFGSNDW